VGESVVLVWMLGAGLDGDGKGVRGEGRKGRGLGGEDRRVEVRDDCAFALRNGDVLVACAFDDREGNVLRH